jgi:hypothetical protein
MKNQCKKYTYQPERQASLDIPTSSKPSPSPTPTSTLPGSQTRMRIGPAVAPGTGQSTLEIETIPAQRKAHLDFLAAQAVYIDGLPFNLYNKRKKLYTLLTELDGRWEPPSRNRIQDTLLEEVHTATAEMVHRILDKEQHLSVVLDETTDNSHNRVINLLLGTSKGFFFIEHHVLQDESITATLIRDWLLPALRRVAGDLSRINSYSVDTCATMGSLANLLQQPYALPQAIHVPCESHGLQLLIKDICESADFAHTVKMANKFASFFHRSSKQYGAMRRLQLEEYHCYKPLILSIITRWGTQFLLCRSLLESRKALERWVYNPRLALTRKQSWIKGALRDLAFWQNLELLQQILDPIHQAQKQSESDKANLGLVKKRWIHIQAELVKLEKIRQLPINWPDFWKRFKARESRQLHDVHVLAFYLLPSNVDLAFIGQSFSMI